MSRFGEGTLIEWPADVAGAYVQRSSFRWLTRDTKILCIGSCFARNFGRWVRRYGVDVVSQDWGLHYNSRTIADEFSCGDSAHTWEIVGGDGQITYCDPKRHPVFASSAEELTRQRQHIAEHFSASLEKADAFVITIGLSEIWEECVDGEWITLNRAPPQGFSTEDRMYRNRFMSPDELAEHLRQIQHSIDACGSLDRPIIFTVSPIPLKATGSGHDPRIANTRSKSIIVTGVHSFLESCNRSFVGYFPAYESFQYGCASTCWQSDGRHVTAEKIDEVCRLFIDIYALDPSVFPPLEGFEVPQV